MKTNTPKINFLRKQRAVLMLQSKRLHLIQMFSFFTLATYAAVLLGVIAYSGYMAFRLKDLDKNIEHERTAIRQMNEVRAKYLVLKEKTGTVMGISTALYRHQEIFEKVLSLLPENLSVNSFGVDEEGVVKFSATTYDSKAVAKFITNTETVKDKGPVLIKNAEVGSVSIDEEGTYSFAVTLQLDLESSES
ncbi:MAG: hypothetical protein ACOX6V_00390 [Patescibacteria group bacterium]|jgi:hypothetical protein